MAVFPKLLDPAGYAPCLQDLKADPVSRAYWIARFKRHVDVLAELPHRGAPLGQASFWPELRAACIAAYSGVGRDWRCLESVTVLSLCELRSRMLRKFGLRDAFAELKATENELALRQFARTVRELDAIADEAVRLDRLTRGVLAANIADFGAVEALQRYHGEEGWDLAAELDRLPARPWPYDDLEGVVARWTAGAATVAHPAIEADAPGGDAPPLVMIFIDNSGPEFILAVLPLARQLAAGGWRVALAANSGPTLNDVTDAEAEALLERAAALDAPLAELRSRGMVRVVDSGCHEPLLDLRQVSVNCAQAAADCTLIVLIGMGRALESNFDAVFTCDCIRLALAKDEMVARLLRVPLFSPVCRFTPAGQRPTLETRMTLEARAAPEARAAHEARAALEARAAPADR